MYLVSGVQCRIKVAGVDRYLRFNHYMLVMVCVAKTEKCAKTERCAGAIKCHCQHLWRCHTACLCHTVPQPPKCIVEFVANAKPLQLPCTEWREWSLMSMNGDIIIWQGVYFFPFWSQHRQNLSRFCCIYLGMQNYFFAYTPACQTVSTDILVVC